MTVAIPTIILTRSGRSVCDVGLLGYDNDDVRGLTLQGIEETAVKARSLSYLLEPGRPVVVVPSKSVRSLQTASLLASELKHRHCFAECRSLSSGVRTLDEFPRPSPTHPLEKGFDPVAFAKDPGYRVCGESFAERFESMRIGVHKGLLLHALDAAMPHLQNGTLNWKEVVQIVLVSHDYNISALVGALCLENHHLRGQPSKVEDDFFHEKFVKAAMKYSAMHEDLLYVSPLLGGKENKLPGLWSSTLRLINQNLMSNLGLSLVDPFKSNVR